MKKEYLGICDKYNYGSLRIGRIPIFVPAFVGVTANVLSYLAQSPVPAISVLSGFMMATTVHGSLKHKLLEANISSTQGGEIVRKSQIQAFVLGSIIGIPLGYVFEKSASNPYGPTPISNVEPDHLVP